MHVFQSWTLKAFLPFALALTIAQLAFAAEKQVAWEEMGERDGIKLFRKDDPSSPMVAFRGEGIVEQPLLKVLSYVRDIKRSTEWVDMLQNVEIIEDNSTSPEKGTDAIIYQFYKTPFVIQNRDFVLHIVTKYDPKMNIVVSSIVSEKHAKYPEPGPCVRGKVIDSRMTFKAIKDKDGKEVTYLTAEINTDLMGSVPKWFVNMVQKGWPYNTISKLREKTAQPDIQINDFYKRMLTGSKSQ